MKQKEKQEKPKYTMGQNLVFLMKRAWKLEKEIIYIPALKEVFDLSLRMLELFIVPVILQTVERKAGIGELLFTIGLFTLALVLFTGLYNFFHILHDRAEAHFRLDMIYHVNEAACTTSYPNALDKNYREKQQQAEKAASWSVASTQMYDDAVTLLGAAAGFVLYLLLMTRVSFLLIVIVLVCSVGGYYLVPNTRRMNV